MQHLKPPARPTLSRSTAVLLVLTSVFLLASCSGSGGSSGGGTTSVSRNLPPDPGAVATATVAGVDTNNNGVRDEVEIALSKVITSDEQYATTIKAASAYQAILTNTPPATRADALKVYGAILCASGTGTVYGASTSVVTKATFDTADRKAKYTQLNALLDGGFDGEELPACQ
jgi:hypothetical protein